MVKLEPIVEDKIESPDISTSADEDDDSKSAQLKSPSPEKEIQDEQPGLTSSRPSTRVTVHRQEISSTTVKEGTDELQDLGVDVYDQQTYENSVFDQVDRAITHGPTNTTGRQDASNRTSKNINDLLNIIHGENDASQQAGDASSLDQQDKDEQVLQLTRLERLNKRVKLERTESSRSEIYNQLPRIPRLNTGNSNPPSTSRQIPSVAVKSELIEDIEDEILNLDDIDESSCSEYKPTKDSDDDDDDDEDDINEDIDYHTDSELEDGQHNYEVGEEQSSNSRKIKDDGDFKSYAARIKAYTRSKAKQSLDNILDDGTQLKKLDETITIDGQLEILKDVWNNLFEHQKTGVRWLWELHQLGTGGILGDEMGLGKTIQMIAFLIALRTSNLIDPHKRFENLGPTILVCPATVMHQWLLEFRKWYPPFRVAILHSTGAFSGDRKKLVQIIHKSRGILICSYPGVIIYQDFLHALDWHYAILDEGHKIRNPDAQVTLACKRFRTPHRIILSGSPVQNNLRELWSIFDFIYPGKLGTLPVFMGQFSIPITQGGYANATDMQVQIAYKCACVLRDTIKPFLLRRTKAEVNNKLKLPDRSEQVLFCKLTDTQRKMYQHYLDSPTVRDIKRGMCQIFVGLIQLRKICNHPDLFDSSECNRQVTQTRLHQEKKLKHMEFFSVDETYGHYQKSGKMMVVDALLKLWKKQGHKVLLFTQSRLMLKLFSNYLDERNYRYLTMDGSTPIGVRHSLIEEFNTTNELFIFLLTTRVGGVGVNLTGANRIIIYDPDWNPSTDIQARERAWRIGQQRQVIIYRLLTAGTIEEKIYHRQVFKLYLTNRILRDAKQKRFFKTNDLHELFTLGHDDKNIETKALFDDDLQIDEKSLKKSKKSSKKSRTAPNEDQHPDHGQLLSEEKIREIRERARRLSQMIASQYGSASGSSEQNKTVKQESCEIAQSSKEVDPSSGSLIESESQGPEGSDSALGDSLSSTQAPPYCPAKQPLLVDQSTTDAVRKTRQKKKVDFLVRQDVYRPEKVKEASSADRDDYILGRLFKNSNISGALKHDKIESDSTADFKVVESEAERVARDAIRALRESRRLCLGSLSGIPNWTGQNGQLASKPRLLPRNKSRAQQMMNRTNAPSGNASILLSIKRRNQSNPVSLASGSNAAMQDSDDEEFDRDFKGKAKLAGADDMADKIRDFVLYKSSINGEAQTDELLEFFKSNFEPSKTAIFKALLYKMCEFHRRGDKGFWKLRTEFRDL